ncbi:MAG: PQQ-dependent sugar dehydrogenase [Pirellulaceae bacterium]|nr:PQQ-dependent sugar dehydrogenase [Pirellulaceae bacterium]
MAERNSHRVYIKSVSSPSLPMLAIFCIAASVALPRVGWSQTVQRGGDDASPARSNVRAPKADWIWAASIPTNQAPKGAVYFRKSIQLSVLEKAQLQIGANDAYEVYVNGKRAGSGRKSEQIDTIDLTSYVQPGDNIIAVRAENLDGTTAGLFARLYAKPRGEGWRGLGTSDTWLASTSGPTGWQSTQFDDTRWVNARPLNHEKSIPVPMQTVATKVRLSDGRANEKPSTEPMPDVIDVRHERFTTLPGFVVDEVVDSEATGSLVAMAFNEFGHIVASRESGPLLLIYDADKDGRPERIRTYSDRVKNIQGILPLNGDVFVTGDGDQGNGLYRLVDQNRDGTLEQATLIVKFQGRQGEHGAHQIALGPDGMLYVIVGNHVQVDGKIDPTSSYRYTYEGDLVQPRQEDPSGHAHGIKAPGGTLVRVDLSGDKVQVVAGGFRNAYDIAFHPTGTFFVHDSDMEADIGTTWHRSTSLFQIVEGGEYGWRSGWANQPEYYFDRLPSLLSTGRSSPTGAIVYNHNVYPKEYHQSLFLADWSEGRILTVDTRAGVSKALGEPVTFVSGRPMNVTDIDVGPDGSLYFCTGGRGTSGGIYRVRWTGDTPSDQVSPGEGIAKAIRQPQMHSAWGRQAVAMLKREMGQTWDEQIAGVAFSADNPARYRVRALDLMQLLGPVPTVDILVELSRSPSEPFRMKVASMLALHSKGDVATKRLNEMLSDRSPLVSQAAAEGLLRSDATCNNESLVPLLESSNRNLAFLGGRLLQRQPREVRQAMLMRTGKTRLVLQAALASIIAEPTREVALRIIPELDKIGSGYTSDLDFVDLLRTYELTLHLGKLRPEDCPKLANWVVSEFPAGEPKINRHLIRLATFLKAEPIIPLGLEYIKTSAPFSERVDAALHLRLIPHTWSAAERNALLKFFESAQQTDAGSSYSLYVMNATREFAQGLDPEEAVVWVMNGKDAPNAALAALPKLPVSLPENILLKLCEIDGEIDQGGFESDTYKRLKTGISAVLARSGDEASQKYLRQIWRRSPDRRPAVALALAQNLDGENWDYVVRSLNVLEPDAVDEVLSKLSQAPVATEDAHAIRQIILHGLKLDRSEQNPASAIGVLEHWTGLNMRESGPNLSSQLTAWQDWYRGKYPDQAEPVLAEDHSKLNWSLDFIEQFLAGDTGKSGSASAGLVAYNKAQCAACHRYNDTGVAFGPDLTGLTKRFARRETLEAILYPSHVVSDQYATKKIMTHDGLVVTGIVSKQGSGLSVRTSDRRQVQIAHDDIEEIIASKQSLMPDGLLENLTLLEIRDLMCYLGYVPEITQLAEPSSTNSIKR